jgi:hypothetical protein
MRHSRFSVWYAFALTIIGHSSGFSAEVLIGGSVLGSIEASKECATGKIEAWLSAGSILLYQADVPLSGTFEFHVTSGSYNLVATNSNGCFVEKVVQVEEGASQNIALKLVSGRKTADGRKPAAFGGEICPYCNAIGNYGYTPFNGYSMPTFYPSSAPWYTGYGAISYSNYYYPSAWSGGGISPGYFPGGGGGFLGKPNIYISGKAQTPVSIHIKLASDSNLLAAVPAYGQTGWDAEMRSDQTLKSGQANYPYFFYDIRLNENKLQDSSGFCTDREHLIPKMSDILAKQGFKENEVKDFESYWSVKMPLQKNIVSFHKKPKNSTELPY